MYYFNKTTPPGASPEATPRWQDLVARYQRPHLGRSLRQVANSFLPFFALWAVMYWSLGVSYWLTLALAIPAAGLLMRVFIILHDCGHGSFFKSNAANDFLGSVCGVFTMTPYFRWRHDHAIHHASSGDLERRGTGDVLTLTVKEYLALPWYKKLGYRIYRHPLVLFGLVPGPMFIVAQRLTGKMGGRRERFGVHWTNAMLVALAAALGLLVGFKELLLIQLPITLIASTAGVWLFYVQHQFEDTYWEHHPNWQYAVAALQGSSYYKLPKLLQWFTGNIGLHHIHHLSPKIPNYNLQKCHDENPLLQQVTVVTFWESLKTIPLKLWDEEQQRLVGFGHLHSQRVESAPH